MRWRMQQSYDDDTILDAKIRAYIDLMRPFTLLAPFIGGIIFALMALVATDGRSLSWDIAKEIFYGAATLVALNAGSNAINQYADVEIDRINKPYRPIPSGMVTESEAVSIGLILWLAAGARALLINPGFFWMVLLIMICAFEYSVHLELKKKFVANNLVIAFSRGLLGPLAGWAIIANPMDIRIVAVGTVLALWSFGATVWKDIPDEEGDREHEVWNFVTKLGVKPAIVVALTFMFAAHLVVVWWTLSGVFPPFAAWFHLFALMTAYIGYSAWSENDPNSMIENRRSWVIMYLEMIMMMGFFLVMFLV